ncbi:DUF3048 domain-containing protein [Candidatus Uhrbacteria bacterium]|nr:DUF3048 domain-containing protein [Candidatus Uhrbacteria bacterium]
MKDLPSKSVPIPSRALDAVRRRMRELAYSPRVRLGAGILLGACVLAAAASPLFRSYEKIPAASSRAASVSSESAVQTERHPLTGLPVAEPVEPPSVFGVMVENMADSWPQSGLEEAFLVIEAPVEAAIPRFLAFYGDDQEVDKIGPVRSARPYYLDWNAEWDALYAHVGGSDAALSLIASGGTFDLNEYWNGRFFWRAKDRHAPHNVYTSSELLKLALGERQERGSTPDSSYGLWTFKDDWPVDETFVVSEVTIDFWLPVYRIAWEYDPETNAYLRSQAGKPHRMGTGNRISTNNVAIMETDVQILDDVGRRKIRTIGTGRALVFQDGRLIRGTWSKPMPEERLRFFDASGEEIRWNAGKTWIEVVPTLEDVDIPERNPTN